MKKFKLTLENDAINYNIEGVNAYNFLDAYGIEDNVFNLKACPSLEFGLHEVLSSKFLSKLFSDKNEEKLFTRKGEYNSLLDISESYLKKKVELKSNAEDIFYKETDRVISNLINECKNGIKTKGESTKFKLGDNGADFLRLNKSLISDWYNKSRLRGSMDVVTFFKTPLCLCSDEKISGDCIKEEIGKLIICLKELKFKKQGL